MNSLPLFNIPESPAKRVAETSRDAYADVKANIGERQLTVLKALAYFTKQSGGSHPTAYELLRFMQRWKPELDLNSVRPRLTELCDGRLVEKDGKVMCPWTRKRVYSWKVSPRGELYLRDKK